MKEQFLNLTGLTELVGYLKTSIANHKEILPYASNKLFPSVGDINTIYIDTATNTIYRWDSSSKTYITLAKAVKSVAISEATENGKITLIVDGNKTTVPIHGLGSAAYTSSSAYSPAGHTHTKTQVGLGNVDNTADANKSVKHATTADSATTAGTATNVSAGEGTADAARHVWFSDSPTETKRAYSDKFKYNPVTNNLTVNVTGNAATANSVAWGNVTGKPSTYAPSAHNHNDSTITSLNASKLFGTIDIARLPHGALERLVIVEDDTARFKLTTANIQLGDTVKVTKTEKMYYVIDESKLSSEDGYSVYTAGTATSVPWSGVTGKPSSYPPASHNHDERYYTETEMNSKLAEKAAKVHTHVKSEVGLGNVDNTADANKSVKYAASAGAAASCTGNAATATTATKLATARSINGTNFDGSGSITTATWGTARNITIGSTKKSVNGGADVSWSLSEIGAAAASHTHSYLPLSGGNMVGTAFINWTDTGNWSNNNSGVTFPVRCGGLSWSGQSDGIQLYAEETGNDNLELVLKFTDDNSNGLSIRNKDGNQTARISSSGLFTGSFQGNISGNASTATKATQDSAGQQINTTYIKGLSVSGRTITYTRGDNTTGTITTQDTNTTYADATTSAHGLMTAADKTKLNGIATGANNYSHPTNSGNKHIPSGGSAGQILRWSADGTAVWGSDNNTTYSVFKGATSSAAGGTGLVPAPNMGDQLKFLRADGTWVVPTNTTYSVGTASTAGITKLYTGTGTATDGTMTQSAIKTALDSKSATGHTHNYAGSSSVGGNANAAVKLATARKIGSASFDGTADITLSQMGVINPIELTRAEYEDLIVNNRIDDNQYYNVIDDYDSDILINDSSVSKKYVYSSDKTEKTYSKRSTTSTVTLSASTWSGSSAPYSYVLSVEGVTATNIIEINYASSASDAAIEAYQGAGLKDGGQSNGRITLLAIEKPTVNIPITIIIRNDL